MEICTKHSTYRGFQIVKVVQESGRVTYDTKSPDGSPDTWGNGSLAIARANIDAAIERFRK